MTTGRTRRLLVLGPIVAGAAAGTVAVAALVAPGSSVAEQRLQATDSLGARLYQEQCASCHGADGSGVTDRGPDLTEEGPAAVDFVLRTGRMPMADPDTQASRGPVRFSEDEIQALVGYAGAFGSGPAVPAVDAAAGDLTAGGMIYRLNCAACHVASGAGAPIGGGPTAPSLMNATPTEVGEAILVGPGAMPNFRSLSSQDIDDVAAYVADLQERDAAGVDSFGGAGPVAEGLAAWLLGLLPLIALTRWIGRPHEGRDVDARESTDGRDLDAGAPG
jgi:quinol---cytochrome-c reductase cytochrome c subunit